MPTTARVQEMLTRTPRTAYQESRAAERKMFSKRLWRLLVAKGWNQSELSRQTKAVDDDGKGIGRDMISGYIRGLHIPAPEHAGLLAKALGISVEELFPPALPGEGSTAHLTAVPPPLEMRMTGDGMVMLHINLEMPMPAALEVLALVQQATSQKP